MLLPISLTRQQSLHVSLIGRVNVTHRRHNRSVPHQLFDLHNVNASIRLKPLT
jgi:hypothetical protein